MSKLLLIGLNEINFDYIKHYCGLNLLPNFQRLINDYGITETYSEKKYENLEPWIQWVTVHTGQTLAEHKIFRLGDITNKEIEQIWETIEKQNKIVGAVSPMNASNSTQNAAFFLPDPWTDTPTSGGKLLRELHKALKQTINNNAEAKVSIQSLFWLLLAFIRYANFRNIPTYLKLVATARKLRWRRAMFLDQMLTDVTRKLIKKKKPDFSSLFLNAGAHIQHHYMFASSAYTGKASCPPSYLEPNHDPVKEIYELYDTALGQLIDTMGIDNLMIVTGLRQVPCPSPGYYWRLKNHSHWLNSIGLKYTSVQPRMSRDFLIKFNNNKEAIIGEKCLNSIKAHDGDPIFEVDNRGSSLFVTLTYSKDIRSDFTYVTGNGIVYGFHEDVVFVAIKNGIHDSIGYLIDTKNNNPTNIPLHNVHRIILDTILT